MAVFRPKLDSILSRFTKVQTELVDFLCMAQDELEGIEQARFSLKQEIERATRVNSRLVELLD